MSNEEKIQEFLDAGCELKLTVNRNDFEPDEVIRNKKITFVTGIKMGYKYGSDEITINGILIKIPKNWKMNFTISWNTTEIEFDLPKSIKFRLEKNMFAREFF